MHGDAEPRPWAAGGPIRPSAASSTTLAAGPCRSGRSRRDRHSSSIVGDAGGLDVDLARRADQLEEHVLRVLADCVRELGHEGLHREAVRDVRDGAEPADPDVRLRLAVLAAEVRRSSNGMSTRPMPSSKSACCFGSGMKVDMMVGATLRCRQPRPCRPGRRRPRCARPRWCGEAALDVVLAGPGDLDRRAAHLLGEGAASSAKSHFDLRPKPPPSSVTCTVTFSIGRPSALATSSRVP